MKKLLNRFGLYTKPQVDARDAIATKLGERIKTTGSDIAKHIAVGKARMNVIIKQNSDIRELEKQIDEMPFKFDHILSKLDTDGLNALFYKMASIVFKDKSKNHLIERWNKRMSGQIDTLESINSEGKESL